MTSPRFRSAGPQDAERIAMLHADSWRRHYRGAYADAFLDGDVVADRRSVWSARLAAPSGSETILAEQDDRLVGFIHVMFETDPRWGSAGAATRWRPHPPQRNSPRPAHGMARCFTTDPARRDGGDIATVTATAHRR
jgi:hypothetical protein